MERHKRFALFVREMKEAAPAASFEEARLVLEAVLNSVEDRHSGVPFDQANSNTDGRMYPPHDDFEKPSSVAGVRVFRTRGHRVFFASNGAIRIEAVSTEIVLDKPGKDGRLCPV